VSSSSTVSLPVCDSFVRTRDHPSHDGVPPDRGLRAFPPCVIEEVHEPRANWNRSRRRWRMLACGHLDQQ
jgi:hypothetical protein